ncbi:L-asparaginase, type I protein (macronuclear) [Tetrahymena thermophila SB210]|uniref:asparaginase n=1 Tax=Tetrahymena thermophila (strain SB210) TaxID=312017 RepID=I7MJV7_TETTS|nr:L-asparaginase, type I protein [Tetrahymena thermophila SB210]EAR97237.1 L-asparaginase, type I protein [Tetrahymena thermophila SB210]|eukprot:XP_001017482.1 L-asparaginase, type I protein [Tetrahymena thermophila SB210]
MNQKLELEQQNSIHLHSQNSQSQERKKEFDKHQAVVFREKHNLECSQGLRIANQSRKVLIICTGGTISMFPTENGLAVKKGFFEKFLREDSYFCDSDYTYFHSSDGFLITPLTIYQQRIWYKIYELENPIDSTNMNVIYYDQIASIIETNYTLYDSFIILHGTDTMAYTASALSFMLENLSKTVILTGSQIPCSMMRNDGFNNLLCSLTIAGHYTIPEVLVCFNDKLFRGNRCTKMDSSAMDSFDSPNFEPLATFKITIKIKWDKVLKRDPEKKFHVQKNLCDKIAIVKMHPFISSDTLKAILTNKDTKAIIIETYGAGNIPINRPELMQMLQEAYDQGKVIVNLSQCYKSKVESIYETGRALLKVGVLCGWDCTTEAMASKLAYLFSKNDSIENIRKNVQKNLRGELSPPIENDMFEFQQENFIQALNDALQYRTNEKIDILKNLILPNIVCYMSKGGFHQSMQQLKVYGIDFDKGDYDNRTGLHLSAREGQLETVKFLIKECKNINTVDKFGRTALFEAVINRHHDVIVELQRAGGIIQAPKQEITSILMEAIRTGDQELFDLFHLGGLQDWNTFQTVDGRNLGHVAATFRQIEIIRFLKYQCKFRFTDKDRWGKTALDEAKKRDFKEICKLLS